MRIYHKYVQQCYYMNRNEMHIITATKNVKETQTRQLCVGQYSLGQEQVCNDLCHTERSSSLHKKDEYPDKQTAVTKFYTLYQEFD